MNEWKDRDSRRDGRSMEALTVSTQKSNPLPVQLSVVSSNMVSKEEEEEEAGWNERVGKERCHVDVAAW